MDEAVNILNQEFLKRRTINPNFSLRSFAKWLNISPSQLSQMMTGKRNITLKSAKKISERLGLSPIEQKSLLSSILKEKQIGGNLVEKKFTLLKEDQFKVISDWYHFAILSLTRIKGVKSDPRWIAKRLGISVMQAHQAILRLERMGIIQIKPVFKQISNPLEVVSTVPSEAIRKYHKQNLNLAIEKIDMVALDYREFQSISIPIKPNQIKLFKKFIDDFLEQASELSDAAIGSEVYNLNVQLFPVTHIKSRSKK